MAFVRDIEKSKNSNEIIRVEVSEFRNQKYLNIRIWYLHNASNEYKPTQKGIAIPTHLFPQLKEAILEAEAEITEGKDDSENHPLPMWKPDESF